MSVGGSNINTATGGTGEQPTTARIDSPISKGPNTPEAPGGKGGFPAARNPYSQQSQVYMPPSQPSFYDQAFSQPYYQQQYAQSPQMGMRNAYVRRPYFSSPSPFNGANTSPMEARPPPGEQQYAGNYAPQGFNLQPRLGGPGLGPPRLESSPAAATRGIASDNINNPAYQQQMAVSNMTDYQRLMQRKNSASAGPYVNPLTGEVGGVNPFTQVSDEEIASSLGWQDPHAARSMLTWARDPMADQVAKDRAEQSKAYLNSIGYGQAGFDASKYEVKRQPTPNYSGGLGSLTSGLGGLYQPGFNTNPMVG